MHTAIKIYTALRSHLWACTGPTQLPRSVLDAAAEPRKLNVPNHIPGTCTPRFILQHLTGVLLPHHSPRICPPWLSRGAAPAGVLLPSTPKGTGAPGRSWSKPSCYFWGDTPRSVSAWVLTPFHIPAKFIFQKRRDCTHTKRPICGFLRQGWGSLL